MILEAIGFAVLGAATLGCVRNASGVRLLLVLPAWNLLYAGAFYAWLLVTDHWTWLHTVLIVATFFGVASVFRWMASKSRESRPGNLADADGVQQSMQRLTATSFATSLPTLGLVLLVLVGLTPARATDEDRLVVHEWGTFTSLQDADGLAVRGINVDDEPVPAFVHRLAWGLVFDAKTVPSLRKGAPGAHPHVTMRLETPVVYFHLPPGRVNITVDVDVAFRGGWITEYYPDGEVAARDGEGQLTVGSPLVSLRQDAVGTIRWRQLHIGGDGEGPETDSHVWLAPRAVDAAAVTAASGASERYLFYRGVAHRDAPIRVLRDDTQDVLRLLPTVATLNEIGPLRFGESWFGESWLVSIREDGTAAFRTLPSWTADETATASGTALPGIATPASFAEIEYSAANLPLLRNAMHRALVDAGLYQDEATAMLRTWELSYFMSSGLRLFFLVPRTWTDHVLPLRLSVPADVERVMVGRIELITVRQRDLLRQIAAGPQGREEVGTGPEQVIDAPLPAPVDYGLFLALGRFRHALLLREQLQRPTEALDHFMESYRIRYFDPTPP